jgi:hypothetical protein
MGAWVAILGNKNEINRKSVQLGTWPLLKSAEPRLKANFLVLALVLWLGKIYH